MLICALQDWSNMQLPGRSTVKMGAPAGGVGQGGQGKVQADWISIAHIAHTNRRSIHR